MSAKVRKYEASLSRIIFEAGARIVERGYDGSGHRTFTFELHGQQRTFHFPGSGVTNGHGLLNTRQRLKWLIAGITPPDEPPLPTVQTSDPLPETQPTIVASLPELVQPRRRRLTKDDRREIARCYIAGETLETLADRYELSIDRMTNLLLSLRGDVAHRCQRDITIRRMTDARRRRELVTKKPKMSLREMDRDTRRALAKEAAKLFFREGRTAAETAERLNLTPSAAYTLAREYA